MDAFLNHIELFFSDATWVAIVATFLAAMLGLSYPLLLQYIDRIGEKYHSEDIARSFSQSTESKLYKNSLYITIGVFFYTYLIAPFFGPMRIACLNNSFFNHTAGILAIGLLCFTIYSFIRCCMLIHSYLFPVLLLEHRLKKYNIKLNDVDLEDKMPIDEEHFKLVTQLLYVAHLEDLRELQFTCQRLIEATISYYQKQNSGQVVVFKEFIFIHLTQLTVKWVNYIDADNRVGRASLMPIFTPFFDRVYNTQLSDRVMLYLWDVVTLFVYRNSHKEILLYWQLADQYWSYQLKGNSQQREAEVHLFKIQHIMLPAYMLYYGKYEMLKSILSFTNSIPAYYYLVPSTLEAIIAQWKELQQLELINPFYFSSHFYFSQENKGVIQESFILDQAYIYLTLLILRLPEISYYISNKGNMQRYNLPQGSENRREQEIISRMRFIFDKYREPFKRMGFDIIRGEQILHDWENQLSSSQIDYESNREIDKVNVDIFADKIEKFFNKCIQWLTDLPHQERILGTEKTIFVDYKKLVEYQEFDKNDYHPSINLHEIVAKDLARTILSNYANLFFIHEDKKVFTIDVRNLLLAIDTLSIDPEKYLILSLGINLENYISIYSEYKSLKPVSNHFEYNKIPVYCLNVDKDVKNVIVIEKSMLPKYQTLTIEQAGGNSSDSSHEYITYNSTDKPYLAVQVSRPSQKNQSYWMLHVQRRALFQIPKQWTFYSFNILYENYTQQEAKSKFEQLKNEVASWKSRSITGHERFMN